MPDKYKNLRSYSTVFMTTVKKNVSFRTFLATDQSLLPDNDYITP
ncbi:hypothetical protein SAMN04488513_1167 [Pseudozobellia thermophila]|uniref:Uncharacterized protein n=1 Tax=Pseudozobellia thermophila TaxID=192903 RepID=A0A1M6NWM0_9FLAO|nr:hypothetical protein SAMN04488513_1167 [Pseudozobellia thermophila]